MSVPANDLLFFSAIIRLMRSLMVGSFIPCSEALSMSDHPALSLNNPVLSFDLVLDIYESLVANTSWVFVLKMV